MKTTTAKQFPCLIVEKNGEQIDRRVFQNSIERLPEGDVLVRVEFSSLNYKDALAATGHPGVTRQFPHVPGIDAAGIVEASESPDFAVGDSVLVAHAKFGTEHYGGYSGYARVPSEWVYPMPPGLTARESMIYGTAGFTAAQCIDKLIKHEIEPDSGPIVVTGATGGVGIFAVKILAKLGYEVVATTGKLDRIQWLKEHGASEVLTRDDVNDGSGRPLLSARWAGAVDTVGGNTLGTVIRGTHPHGCVTACGVVGGADINVTVYPFILRGVVLAGADSAGLARNYRQKLWERLATEWAVSGLDQLAREVDIGGLDAEIENILAGKVAGRVIVSLE